MLPLLEIALSFLVIYVCFLFYEVNKRPPNYPPGPFQLPVFGYLPFFNKNAPYLTLEKLRRKFGDVFGCKMGVHQMVYVQDYNLAKEVLNHPDCQGRVEFYSFMFFNFGAPRGLIGATGEYFIDHRRFTLRSLRDFGFGKASLEEIILTEVKDVIQQFKAKEEKPFNISYSFNIAIANIIWHMAAGSRLATDDPELLEIMESTEKDVELVSSSLIDFLPWIDAILSKEMTNVKYMQHSRDLVYNYIMKLIKNHEDTYDPNNMRDFVDIFLRKMYEEQNRGSKFTTFTRIQLYCVLGDLLVAGSDTTSTTLRFIFIFLLHHPELQEKLQKEIKDNVGLEQLPSLSDRSRLPLVDAFILESQRLANIVPLGVPHCTTDTMKLGDYVLPKNTGVVINQYAIHRDPKYWPNPEKFDLTRFLSEDGTVMSKKDGFLPFSLGKRQCLGESLAKAELFLFVTSLLQNFTFSLPPGAPLPSTSPRKFTLVMHPHEFDLIATPVSQM